MINRVANLNRKTQLVTDIVVAVVILGGLLTLHITQPERSVTNYCKVYRQEKTRLRALSNDQNPYPSGVFDVSVADAGEVAQSLGKLERVAPPIVEPDIKTLQNLYQEIHEDPSKAIAASLSGGTIDDNVNGWTQSHCPAN